MKDQPNHDAGASSADRHASSWFERNVGLIKFALLVACVLTVVAQFVFANKIFDDHHPPHFPPWEDFPGFQAIFGFVAFVVVVFLGRMLRPIIMRREDYYDA